VTKPFQIEEFLLTVGRAADKRRLELRAKEVEEQNVRNLYDLNLEKSRLRTIINCMANGVMVTNRSLEMVLHNPALMRLLEVAQTIEDPIPLSMILKDQTLIDALVEIQEKDSSENEFLSQEIELGDRVLRAISAPALGPDREVVGTVTVLENITAFKQLDRMKSDFLSMVAHELRSPLVSIRQIHSVLLEGLAGPLDKKQEDFVQRSINKIDSLVALINDLLDMARVEAGVAVQRRVSVDLRPIIEELVRLISPRAEEQGVEIHCSFENLKIVQADPKNMEEVFNNLISNAINYSPDGGVVAISVRGLGEYLEIMVEDKGVGIPPEELPKIFDRFYRVKDPRTRKVMGTGLGLSIVKGIVEAHHGSIDVQSTVGKGTTFKILLPFTN
jgi:signal transduction histidine kinase